MSKTMASHEQDHQIQDGSADILVGSRRQDGHSEDDDYDEGAIRIEAEAAVREIGFAVEFVQVSTKLRSTDQLVYLNLTTREGQDFCVELCLQGFRIVGKAFDTVSMGDDVSRYYETIYSLLDSLSPGYRCSFGEALQKKLSALQDSRTDASAADDSS